MIGLACRSREGLGPAVADAVPLAAALMLARTVLLKDVPLTRIESAMTTTLRLLALLRPAARILTGSTYALLGFDALRAPGARVDHAAVVLAAVREIVPLPADDAMVVRGNAAVQVLGGTLLALAGSLIPTTLAGHAYWTIEDPAARKLQRIQFHKNMAMIGGLLFAVLDQPQAHP